MITIIADDKIPFLKGALEPYASVVYLDGLKIKASAFPNADAMLIRTRTVCNKSTLEGSGVKFIATATIGYDHIDTEYCDAHSVHWINAPGCNAASVQQYIASVLANLVVRHDFSISGKTMGIIGVGHVGRKVEALASLLGMRILLNDPPRARAEGETGFVSLEQLLKESDVVTLHVPLNKTGEDRTFHLIGTQELTMLKDNAWLINSSRGEVMDSIALKSALSNHRIAGTVIDVWENEPAVDMQLLEMITIASPHIAGYSTDGKRNGTVHIVRNLGRYFDLPVQEWEPSGIPEPADPVIILDCQDQSPERLACQAILHTYDVAGDDFRFRSNPGDFEKQRGQYPVRREFPAYKIILLNGNSRAREILEAMGFIVIEMKK
ncbi:MAG: 4-phosphoerythronate dehydrogenase [Bacteroidota bacterium]